MAQVSVDVLGIFLMIFGKWLPQMLQKRDKDLVNKSDQSSIIIKDLLEAVRNQF